MIDFTETLLGKDVYEALLIIGRAATLPATYKSEILRITETAETLLVIENENAPGDDHSENSPDSDKVVNSHNVNSAGNIQDVNSPAVKVIVHIIPVMNTLETFLAQ